MTHNIGLAKKACLLMLVCAFLAAIVPDVFCYPPAGIDYMEYTTATIELQIYGSPGFTETLTATGPTTVNRSDPTVPEDNRTEIDTEIISMTLTGNSPNIGPITIIQSPSKASTGKIKQQSPGQDFPADSYFDVYIEIKTKLLYPLGTLHNDVPKHMSAVIYSIPPSGSTYENLTTIYLFDESDSLVGAMLATRHHVDAHDIAIIDIAGSKAFVGQGYGINITTMAINQGDFAESFSVTIYGNETVIATFADVILSSGASTHLNFTWNTAGFAKGNYTLSAYAWPVENETDIDNNNFTDSWIKVTIVGDVNGDGKVNLIDVFSVALAFGSYPGHPKWNPNYDINNDGKINLLDYFKTALNFGKTDP